MFALKRYFLRNSLSKRAFSYVNNMDSFNNRHQITLLYENLILYFLFRWSQLENIKFT